MKAFLYIKNHNLLSVKFFFFNDDKFKPNRSIWWVLKVLKVYIQIIDNIDEGC